MKIETRQIDEPVEEQPVEIEKPEQEPQEKVEQAVYAAPEKFTSDTPLGQEAEQLFDDDPRNDEINNEAIPEPDEALVLSIRDEVLPAIPDDLKDVADTEWGQDVMKALAIISQSVPAEKKDEALGHIIDFYDDDIIDAEYTIYDADERPDAGFIKTTREEDKKKRRFLRRLKWAAKAGDMSVPSVSGKEYDDFEEGRKGSHSSSSASINPSIPGGGVRGAHAGVSSSGEQAFRAGSAASGVGPSPAVEENKGGAVGRNAAASPRERVEPMRSGAWMAAKGGIIKNSSKPPKWNAQSSQSQGGAKLKKSDNSIQREEVRAQILAESRNWETNDQGKKDSKDRYDGIRILVAGNDIEVSEGGNYRKFENLDDEELTVIQRALK